MKGWRVLSLLLVGGTAAAQVVTPRVGVAAPASPPPQVSTPPAAQGTAPMSNTPTVTQPGLAVPPAGGALPSDQGLPGSVLRESRPPAALSPTQVVAAQSALAGAGFYRGPVDGVLTGTVRGAVRAFQQASQLPVTGDLDADTLALLGVAPTTPTSTSGATSTNGTPPASTAPTVTLPQPSPPATSPSASGAGSMPNGETFPLSPPPASTTPIFIQP
jgi:peptidoglycan hydrolase-like protein with peptidoglycan-binding domain